jgi:hypothetical protein
MNFMGGRLAIINFLGGSLAICRYKIHPNIISICRILEPIAESLIGHYRLRPAKSCFVQYKCCRILEAFSFRAIPLISNSCVQY